MQTAEDVQREVITLLAAYLSWFHDRRSHMDVGGDSPWATRLLHPYVCQRGLAFEIGTLPTREHAMPITRHAMTITHTEHSALMWYTQCKFHQRDRRDRFMGCHCHPISRPDLLAAYRLGGIDAIGSKTYERGPYVPANQYARVRYVEKPTYRSHYQEMLADEWRRMVARLLRKVGFGESPTRLHDIEH